MVVVLLDVDTTVLVDLCVAVLVLNAVVVLVEVLYVVVVLVDVLYVVVVLLLVAQVVLKAVDVEDAEILKQITLGSEGTAFEALVDPLTQLPVQQAANTLKAVVVLVDVL